MPFRDELENYKTGTLRFGETSGFHGHLEDITLCVQSVSEPGRYGWVHQHQCSRKRGYGYKGLFCKQHAKRYEYLEKGN